MALQDKSFSQCVADILNLFFNARLDAWDVDFCIGRYPAKLVPMGHRVTVAEVWHNTDYDFTRVVHNLSSRIRGIEDTTGHATDWAWITIRIATLFGLYGKMCRVKAVTPGCPIDIALPSGDFAGPMAAWYARKMGLPIANIICSCDENDAAWDLIRNGAVYPNPSMNIPSDLERLISATLDRNEANRFAQCMESNKAYILPEGTLAAVKEGMYPAVISWKRRESIISNVYSASTYILDPGSAMAYGGLQDYRASVGESRATLILTERGPICSADTVAKAMGITFKDLKDRLNMN